MPACHNLIISTPTCLSLDLVRLSSYVFPPPPPLSPDKCIPDKKLRGTFVTRCGE